MTSRSTHPQKGRAAEPLKYGHKVEVWEAAKEEGRRIVSKCAKSEQFITYGELADQIRTLHFEAHDHVFDLMLGEISEEEDAAGRGMLSALVVHKDNGRPGKGFYELAKRLDRNTVDWETCWVKEVEKVFVAWRQTKRRQCKKP